LVAEIFGQIPVTKSALRSLLQVPIESLGRKFSFGVSGIVVAGFGSKETLPAISAHEVDGLVGSTVRMWMTGERACERSPDAMIIPFAQREMVNLFMDGVDPFYYEGIKKLTAKTLAGMSSELLKTMGTRNKKKRAQIADVFKSLSAGLFDAWEQGKRSHWVPIIQTVASLPKDELAATAEALVNLTKFRRRASTDRETVGGPIDVAVITKGDGFVWIRRKHYFELDRNVRVIGARLRGDP